MPNKTADLDQVFKCLSNPTRRHVLERLAASEASMTELAEPLQMALPSFLQHLRMLEDAGLVRSRKRGRVRTYTLVPEPIARAEHWLDAQRRRWNTRLDQLDAVLENLDNNAHA